MSILKKYGLEFLKKKLTDGEIYPIARQKIEGGDNSVLTFVDGLDKHECEAFLSILDRCIDSQGNADEGFFSDSVEHMEILFQYPNVIIDDILTITMLDMKGLLEEWLEFIS